MMERHLHGIPRDGLLPKIQTLDGAGVPARGYHSHEWDEDVSRGLTQSRGVQPETWADAEVEIVDERDKNQGRPLRTMPWAVRQQTPLGTLWGVQKNAEANDRAHDLNQNSLQALDALAKEYVDFEATKANVTSEHEAGDVLHAATLSRPSTGRSGLLVRCTGHGNHIIFRRAAHEELCVDAKKVLRRTFEVKRKASEIQEGVATHRERTRRITNKHARAEGHVNDGIGSLGKALQAVPKATHSLTCGVPDRESNETKYLREATELLEEWQHRLQSGQPMSGPPSEHSEVILVERHR